MIQYKVEILLLFVQKGQEFDQCKELCPQEHQFQFDHNLLFEHQLNFEENNLLRMEK